MVAAPLAPSTGMATLVPPSKSMPKVKPRNSIASTEMATMTPLTRYQNLRLPMTSKAPVPVYSRTKKPCCGAEPVSSTASVDSVPECLAAI